MSDFGLMIDFDVDWILEVYFWNYVLVVLKSGKIMCIVCLLYVDNIYVGVLYIIMNWNCVKKCYIVVFKVRKL